MEEVMAEKKFATWTRSSNNTGPANEVAIGFISFLIAITQYISSIHTITCTFISSTEQAIVCCLHPPYSTIDTISTPTITTILHRFPTTCPKNITHHRPHGHTHHDNLFFVSTDTTPPPPRDRDDHRRRSRKTNREEQEERDFRERK